MFAVVLPDVCSPIRAFDVVIGYDVRLFFWIFDHHGRNHNRSDAALLHRTLAAT